MHAHPLAESPFMSQGIYHLESGRVEFLGPSPKQAALLASESVLNKRLRKV